MRSTLSGILLFLVLTGCAPPVAPATEADAALPYSGTRLAADEQSARWKTGEIDPAVVQIPPELDEAVKSVPRVNLTRLVAYLAADAADDYQLVKRIHDWITTSFSYQFIAETSVYDFIPQGRTNCVGYSLLFCEMTKLAGLRAVMVIGFSRTYVYASGRQGDHAWNVVWIRDKPYIVDTTHDSMLRSRSGGSGAPAYADDELFLKPEYKLYLNLPYEPSYQLVYPALSFARYLAAPRVRLSFLRHALAFADPSFVKDLSTVQTSIGGNTAIQGVSDCFAGNSGRRRITLQAPAGESVRLLLTGDTSSFEATVSRLAGTDLVFLDFSLPQPGSYNARLEARDANAAAWEFVYALRFSYAAQASGGAGEAQQLIP